VFVARLPCEPDRRLHDHARVVVVFDLRANRQVQPVRLQRDFVLHEGVDGFERNALVQ
jgi:hypothetical protein